MSSHFRTGLILADTNNYQRVPRRDKHHKTMPSNRNTKYESTTNVETGPKLNSLAESLASKGCVQLEELKRTIAASQTNDYECEWTHHKSRLATMLPCKLFTLHKYIHSAT